MENLNLKSILLYDLRAALFLVGEKCTQMCPLSSNEYVGELDTSRHNLLLFLDFPQGLISNNSQHNQFLNIVASLL